MEQKNTMNLKFFLLFSFITLLVWGNFSITQAQTYNEHDKAALRSFLIQESSESGKKNLEQVGLSLDDVNTWETTEDWVGKLSSVVNWDKNTPKRLTEISWILRSLAGTLNMSGCEALTRLEILDNSLTSINLEGCQAIKTLRCEGNELTELNLKSCEQLKTLYCYDNKLVSLDVNESLLLLDFRCYSNLLTSLKMEKLSALTYLDCKNNRLTTLDLDGCVALNNVLCQLNRITSLDVSQAKSLKYLDCYNNQLTSLSAEGCAALIRIYTQSNQLDTLNINGCTALDWLNTESNTLTSLDLLSSSNLRVLYCEGNQLPLLDVTACPKLEYFGCGSNNLTSIDISKNPLLKLFSCNYNEIKSLETDSNTVLKSLSCNNNQISMLDVTKLTELIELKAAYQSINNEDLILVENGTVVLENSIFFNGIRVENIEGDFDSYITPNITWKNIPSSDTIVSYTFKATLPSGVKGSPLSGTVFQAITSTTGINTNTIAQESNISVVDSRIVFNLKQNQEAYIYSAAGQLLNRVKLLSGEASIEMSAGIYIVRLTDGTTTKCIVNK